MARAAGDSTHYEFVLRNKATGRFDDAYTIRLPSSTHVIGAVLAKQSLPGHVYRQTRDIIAGLVAVTLEHGLPMDEDLSLLDILTDGDVLEEWLKENHLTDRAILKMHAERGTEQIRPGASDRLVQQFLDGDDGWAYATADWWRTYKPRPVDSERLLPNVREGYAGTVDLVWRTQTDLLEITDLKSRLADREVYESDEYQVDSYDLAYEANGLGRPDQRSVLVVREDGTYVYSNRFIIERGEFLDLLTVYRQITRKR
jgi:hypothetical protein